MHRFVAALIVISVMVCARARAQDAGVRAPTSACASAVAETLFARTPETSRLPFFLVPPEVNDEGRRTHYEERAPRVLEVDLDGEPPREAVLVLEAIHAGEPSASGVFVFACRARGWEYVDRVVLDIDSAWEGTIDETPGVVAVTTETIAGIGHPLLRIEHLDLRGGADPRFLRHRLMYVHLVDGAVVTALDVVTGDLVFGGPERETISDTTRALRLVRGRAPRFRFVLTREEERPRRRSSCSTWLVFDGRTFVPRDAACAAR